jgi:hypothetical protein
MIATFRKRRKDAGRKRLPRESDLANVAIQGGAIGGSAGLLLGRYRRDRASDKLKGLKDTVSNITKSKTPTITTGLNEQVTSATSGLNKANANIGKLALKGAAIGAGVGAAGLVAHSLIKSRKRKKSRLRRMLNFSSSTPLATFRRTRKDKGRKRLKRNLAIAGAGTLALGGVGVLALRGRGKSKSPYQQSAEYFGKKRNVERRVGQVMGASGFDVKRGQAEGFAKRAYDVAKEEFPVHVRTVKQAAKDGGAIAKREYKAGVGRHNAAVGKKAAADIQRRKQLTGKLKSFVDKGVQRDRIARQKLGKKIRGVLGLSAVLSLAEFKRSRKPLTTAHKKKISDRLKRRILDRRSGSHNKLVAQQFYKDRIADKSTLPPWSDARKNYDEAAKKVDRRASRRELKLSSQVELSEFKRVRKGSKRKPLSRLHKQKISQALKSRSSSRKNKPGDRVLAIRESEAKARTARNVGYITNAVSQGVREARLTARWLGINPRGAVRQSLSYGKGVGNVRQTLGVAKDLSSLLR